MVDLNHAVNVGWYQMQCFNKHTAVLLVNYGISNTIVLETP